MLHNGQIRPSQELALRSGQVGLFAGWGIFSTLKIVDGVLFAFDRHWARLRKDAELLRVPFPWSPAELESILLQVVEANQDLNATMRVLVTRNKGTMWGGPGVETDIDLVAFTAPRNEWGEAARLGVVPNARHAANRFSGAKSTSWSMNLVWHEEAHQQGLDEVVLLNERQEVSECTSANIFAVFGDTAVTPPLSSGCLPGITRLLLLEDVKVPGITVAEQTLTLADLRRADSIFITSSTRDLLPVSAVDGVPTGQDQRVYRRLLDAFLAFEKQYALNATQRACASQPAR
jgi:branched-chain amino acid aminotransferase